MSPPTKTDLENEERKRAGCSPRKYSEREPLITGKWKMRPSAEMACELCPVEEFGNMLEANGMSNKVSD